MIIAALVFIALVILFFTMSGKKDKGEREGVVKEVLSKDALRVQFSDSQSVIVKFYGLSMACETEMMDENILAYLNEQIVGQRVKLRSSRIDVGDVHVAEVYTLADEYINAIMIEQGFARWNPTEGGSDSRLSNAQEFAKKSMLGVWNPAIRKIAQESREEGLEEEEAACEEPVEGGGDERAAPAS